MLSEREVAANYVNEDVSLTDWMFAFFVSHGDADVPKCRPARVPVGT